MTTEKAERWGIWNCDQDGWSLDVDGSHRTYSMAADARGLINAWSRTGDLRYRLEVRPYPAPSACPDCKAAPCDCEKEIWTYWVRYQGGVPYSMAKRTRKATVMGRGVVSGIFDYGPVQRITDPPYRFEEAKAEEHPAIAAFQREWEKWTPAFAQAPARSFDAASLARALFDVEMLERGPKGEPSEAERIAEWIAAPGMEGRDEDDDAALKRVLDTMWSSTKPGARLRCERLAAKVCVRMGRSKS